MNLDRSSNRRRGQQDIRLAIAALVFVTAGLTLSGNVAIAQSSEPIGEPVITSGGSLDDMISAGDFRGALADLQATREPYDLRTSLARAELLLMAGYDRQAEDEFVRVRLLTPSEEPIADYGAALCEMMRRDLPVAAASLKRCTESSGSAAHVAEISLALASLQAAEGRGTSAIALANSSAYASGLLLSDEVEALAGLGSTGLPQPGNISPWLLPGGVPRVEEPFGLRAEALVIAAAKLEEPGSRPVAAPLSGGDAAAQIASAILPGEFPKPGLASARIVSGSVMLAPPPGSSAAPGAMGSYSIDGNVVAIVNSDSLAYRWDTTRYANGLHTVEITMTPSGGGSNLPLSTLYYDVRNAQESNQGASAVIADGDERRPQSLTAFDQQAVEDAWRILALQPDYAIGERVLAALAERRGSAAAALYHSAVAQAIAFNGNSLFLRQIGAAYGDRLPKIFANVDRTGSHPEATTVGIWRGNRNLREIALTFDDGPSPTATPPLLDALKAANAHGTFFVVGARAELAPEIVRRMHCDGHEVEDHSYTHPNLDEATPQHVFEEILRNAVIVQALTGTWPHFLRPPGGQSNPRVLQAAAKCGLTGAFWTVDALSAEDTGSPEAVVRFVMKRVKPGAVILMHNGPYATTHAVPTLTRELREQGYSLVTLLQLARDTKSH